MFFLQKKKCNWSTGFNITKAKLHLMEECPSVASDIKEWLLDVTSSSKMTSPPKSKILKLSSESGSIMKFAAPNYQKSVLDESVAKRIIIANVEMFLSFFDSPVWVKSPFCVDAMRASCGSGIMKFIPSNYEVWKIVKDIDKSSTDYMFNRLKLEPGNLTMGFDGVTALGTYATLYTFSKGSMSLFLTIR